MAGRTILLTARDQQIIAEVSRFGAMTREQAQRLRLFRSGTRAKARLKQLVDAGYLLVRRQPILAGGPRCVYLPSPLTESGPSRTRNSSALFLSHQLGLVDIRIVFEQAATILIWRSDRELSAQKLEVIPDAYLESTVGPVILSAFVEFDRGTEALGRIERKARAYINLAYSGQFTRLFHRQYFRVLMVTDSLGRLEAMSHVVAGQTDRIFRFTLLSELQNQGPLASIWRRPGLRTLESLTDS
jgi:hypothetical protein